MEDIWFVIKALIMGVVEGLSEFLPISSTGHLIITQNLLKWPNNEYTKMFSVVIQLGAILAVLLLFWPKIWTKLKSFFRGEKEGRNFMLIWVIGCIPAAVLGVLGNDFIDEHLFSVPTVIAALVVGGILMIVTERRYSENTTVQSMDEITPKQALIVGLLQCVSLWPGFSRSAATIMGGWVSGFSTSLAAEYSFFLAIPIMFGASGYSLLKVSVADISTTQWVALIIAFLTAFVVALLVVKQFMAFLRKHKLRSFAYYRFALSAVLLILMLTGVVTA